MYLIAAAKRSEQGRLLNFVRVADYLVSDGLREVLNGTLNDVLQKVERAEVVDSEVKDVLGQASSLHGQVPQVLMDPHSATIDESLPYDKSVGHRQLFMVELVMEMDNLIILPMNSMFDNHVRFLTTK